jgi:hypothetical protein
LSSAFGSTGESIENGAVVGIEGSLDNQENDTIDVDIDDVTVAGFDGTPRIERSGGVGDQSDFITISGDGVTFKNIKIDDTGEKDTSRLSQVNVTGSNVTINGIEINAAAGESDARTGLPNIGFDNATNVTVVNCESRSGPIGGPVSGDVTINNNFTTNTFAEGIFANGGTDGSDFTVQRNLVEKHGQDNDDAREIKIKNPSEVNGQTDNEDQIESLLTENNISSAKVAGNVGGIITNQSNPFGTTLQEAINTAGQEGFVQIEGGTFEEDITPVNGITIQGLNGASIENKSDGISLDGADNVTLRGLTVANHGTGLDVPNGSGPTGLLVENCSFNNNDLGWFVANDANNAEVSSTFDDVTVRDTTFNDNTEKGIYIEKINNATFENIEVVRSGKGGENPAPAGIDINLKFGDYSNITIKDSLFDDSGINNDAFDLPNLYGALQLKARGTGGDDRYSDAPDSNLEDQDAEAPAKLTDVTVKNNEFTFSASSQASTETVAIRAGEGNNLDPDLEQPTPGEELEITENRFENADDEIRDLTR